MYVIESEVGTFGAFFSQFIVSLRNVHEQEQATTRQKDNRQKKLNRTLTCNGITLINMRFNTIHVVSRSMNKIPSLQNVEKEEKTPVVNHLRP